MKELKKELKELVVSSKEKLFKRVSSSLKIESTLKDDFELIRARYYSLLRDFNLNVIAREDYDIEMAKISKSLIDMINLIKHEDINQPEILGLNESILTNKHIVLSLFGFLILGLSFIIFNLLTTNSNSQENPQVQNSNFDLTLLNSTTNKKEQPKSIFESKIKNLMIFSGTTGDGISFDSKKLDGGLFTHFLSKGINGSADADSNNIISIQELFNYVSENVSDASNGVQNPTLRFVHGKMNQSIKGKSISEIYCLSIGVSNYQNSAFSLRYSAKDARKFGQSIQNFGSSSQIYILTDESATKDNIEKKLNLIIKNSTKDDLVYIYYSGHGGLDKNFEYNMAPFNFNFQNYANGIPFSKIESMLGSISASQIIMLLDSCHSGELNE
ncbi:MAG: caspase family protein [Haliscomenobacter sp.]|uniref:caspase family protein n=1 Tax=Haliscomenobacter sp. TaxID=2717303 RepID=UPI0029A9CDAA|nr:caspase family protein [Haliscomenobacter sp.]MDX2068529.1 caspase family protein [Haliscomenobacter sp.]